jgi:AraC-like DNA-binding protein
MTEVSVLRKESLFGSADALASITREPNQLPFSAHRHDFVEIAVIVSGRGVHTTGLIRHEVCGGDVLVINGERSHAYENTESLSLINLLVLPKFLRKLEPELGNLPGFHPLFTFEFARWEQEQFRSRLRLRETEFRTIITWIDTLEAELGLRSNLSPAMVRSLLCLIIGTLARQFDVAPNRASSQSGLDWKLGRILTRIENDPALNLGRASLAKEAGVSERTFLRCFQRAMGCSPREYITRLRIHRAQALLLNHARSLNITDIAFLVGYNDSNYFSRQFRRLTGKSPKAFRTNHN